MSISGIISIIQFNVNTSLTTGFVITTRKLTHRFAVVAIVVVAVTIVGHGQATHSQEEHRTHKVGQNLGLDKDCDVQCMQITSKY